MADLNSSWTTEEHYSHWLDENVQEEEQICREGKALCVQVRETGKQAVAWASYEDDVKIPGGFYIRQMMVEPYYKKMGLGGILLNDVVSTLRPKNIGTFLITRKTNTVAISFYEKNGFRQSSYMHDGYDVSRYVGLERSRSVAVLFAQMREYKQGNILKIVDANVKSVPIQEQNEPLVDLADVSMNPIDSKIRLMPDESSSIMGFYHAPHSDFGKVRVGLHKKLKELVSPVDNKIPPHLTGGAVDLTLIKLSTGKPLPMGKFGAIFGSNPVAQTFVTVGLTEEEQENRKLLYRSAAEVGLVNYPEEWWHYAIGDRYSSYVLGLDKSVYGDYSTP